jgi:hypothetical protein
MKDTLRGTVCTVSAYPSYSNVFSRPYRGYKLELASARTKHHTEEKPPLSRDMVIKPHSMINYRLLNGDSWATNPFTVDSTSAFYNMRHLCSMEITPDGPYKPLQFSISGTAHTSNQVIASQGTCSMSITLHDYEAFGHLRAGHKLQWRNMLKELRRGILSISHRDVHILFLQALWQAEAKSKSNTWRREAHTDAAESAFGLEALKEMTDLLDKIESNWTWSYACGTLVAMAARVLSLASGQDVQSAAIMFLKRARKVAHQWLKVITGDVSSGRSAEATVQKQRQVLLAAMVCCSTFNVDEALVDLVFDPAQDISLLVECRNLIYMSKPPALNSLPFALRVFYDRDQLLALRFLPRMTSCIRTLLEAQRGLDEGIRALWDGYAAGSGWNVYDSPDERWCTTTTGTASGLRGVDIHFNILGTDSS